jgi:Diguanylate cyclase, GGDEF domain
LIVFFATAPFLDDCACAASRRNPAGLELIHVGMDIDRDELTRDAGLCERKARDHRIVRRRGMAEPAARRLRGRRRNAGRSGSRFGGRNRGVIIWHLFAASAASTVGAAGICNRADHATGCRADYQNTLKQLLIVEFRQSPAPARRRRDGIARQPADIAFRPMNLLVGALVGLGIVVAVAGILLTLVTTRRITAPIRHLTDAADRIGRDPNCTTVPPLEGPSKVMRLASVLRLLLHRIGFAEQRTLEVEHRGAIGILMVDIDHFKSINDRYGHAAGDAVIRAVADTMATAIRGIDKPARFGGEEFIVLVHTTVIAGLLAEGERIRGLVEAHSVVHSGDVRLVPPPMPCFSGLPQERRGCPRQARASRQGE